MIIIGLNEEVENLKGIIYLLQGKLYMISRFSCIPKEMFLK